MTTVSNEIPDYLDMLSSIINNHSLIIYTCILPYEFQEWFDDKLMKLDIKLDVKSFIMQILIMLNL